MIGPWPKPQGACGPFDIWPPGGGIFYWLQKPNRGPKKFSLCLNIKSLRERVARVKHSSEKGTGDTLAHYCWKN